MQKTVVSLLALIVLLGVSSTLAQGVVPSLEIDTSIRSAGMGGANAAVWWGEPEVWGNPASLASVQGVGWLDGRTRLVPGLASDVWLKSSRLLLGGAGVGLSFLGDPIDGLGHERLDYGASFSTDPFGNFTGTFNSFEKTRAWGVGVSPIQLLDAFRGLHRSGGASRPRRFDVAAGVQRKRTAVELLPDVSFGGVSLDWGVSGRVSLLTETGSDALWRVILSAGYAVLNAGNAKFNFPDLIGPDVPTARYRRAGFALDVSTPSLWSADGGGRPIWLLARQRHALELGLAVDFERRNVGEIDVVPAVRRYGMEATLLGLVTGRVGYVDDRFGEITDITWGAGARLPLGPWASVSYDRASVPQAHDSGLPNVTRQGWSVWLDPVRMWSDGRAKP